MPDALRLGEDVYAWSGPWPPPMEIYVVRLVENGAALITLDREQAERLAEGNRVEWWAQVSCSQLPDEASEHLVRGAEYELLSPDTSTNWMES